MNKLRVPLGAILSIVLFATMAQIGFALADTTITVNKILIPNPITSEQGFLTENDFDLFVGPDTLSGIQVQNGVPETIVPDNYSIYEKREINDNGSLINRELINYLVTATGDCIEDTELANQLLARQTYGAALAVLFQVDLAEAEIKALQGQIDDLQSQIDVGGDPGGLLQAQIDAKLNEILIDMQQIVIKHQQAAPFLGQAQALLQSVDALLNISQDEHLSCNIINTYDPIFGADLSIEKSAPSTAMPGEEITYTIIVTNHGPGDQTIIWVDDYLPVGASLVSVTPSDGTCNNQNVGLVGQTGFRCEIDTLLKESSFTITVVAVISPSALLGSTVTNTVSIAGIDLVDQNDLAMSVITIGDAVQLVGGQIIPIEQTSLLLAGLQTSAIWLAPVVISAVGVGLVLVRRN